jgi:hypothetical protein
MIQTTASSRDGFFGLPLIAAVVLWGLLLVLTACGGAAAPSVGPPKASAELRLAVLDAVGGHLVYCDPDVYPVAHTNPLEAAQTRLPTIKADGTVFNAILAHEQLRPDEQFTADQLIAINNLYKQMQAIDLQPAGSGFTFSVLVVSQATPTGNQRLAGTVTDSGMVTIDRRDPGERVNCPICLIAGVRISSPSGDFAVQDVQAGAQVWTTDLAGRRVAGIVLAIGSTRTPIGHEVVSLILADGRSVVASPGHPTADGRSVGDLRPGDPIDGSRVVATDLVSYEGTTYDLLPSGSTGSYFANGILLGSTLAHSR